MTIARIVCLALTLAFLILIVRVILSWIPSLPEPIRPLARGVYRITDPALLPLRRVLPPVQAGGMGFDLSPIIAFFVLSILRGLFCRIV